MSGILVSGYDVDIDHMADVRNLQRTLRDCPNRSVNDSQVFEDLATDIRRGNVHVTHVADAVDANAEDAIEYEFELSFIVDGSALTMDYLNGRLVETDMKDV
jgi:hypothetical protein